MCHGCDQTQDMTESHFCMIIFCAHMVQENKLGHAYVNSLKAHWKYVLVAIFLHCKKKPIQSTQ